MTYPATTYAEGVELAITSGNQLHEIINGAATEEINTESGMVPSVRKALADSMLFKPAIAWAEGSVESDPFQTRLYGEGIYWAPAASNETPISMGTNPNIDGNWFLAPVTGGESISRNTNLLSNHNFIIQSPDDITYPSATPTDYASGTQVFSGVFVGDDIVGLTYIDGRVSWTSGTLYFSVPNVGALEYVDQTDLVTSVADFDGKPRTRGVSYALVGDEYRVTVDIDALEDESANETLLGSVKFEQGSVATGHESGSLSVGNLSDYTDIVYKASGGNSAVENMVAGIPIKCPVGAMCRAENSSFKRISDSSPSSINDFEALVEVYASDYGCVDRSINPSFDSNPMLLEAIEYLNSLGGGVLIIDGQYNCTRLPIYSLIHIKGLPGAALVCTDSTSTDPNVTFGSCFKKPDDGNRVVYFKITGGLYLGTALSGVSAAEDLNQNVIGVNLCGCERSTLDISLGGFGYGGYVLARAEAGSEGLGFLNTTQDGNYNNINIRSMGFCGAYNPDEAAAWFKYKANSNNVFSSYAKGLKGRHFSFPNANNNTIHSSTTESSAGIAEFGSLGVSNMVLNPRGEVVNGDAFEFDPSSETNYVFGGRLTGVTGDIASGYQGTKNTVIVGDLIYYPTITDYPPTSDISTKHNQFIQSVQGVFGKVGLPHFVKSDVYNDKTSYPQHGLLNTVTASISGDTLGEYVFYNMDASTGARGISAALEAFFSGSGGQTSLGFKTGTGTTLSRKWEIGHGGNLSPSVDASCDIGYPTLRVDTIHLVNAPSVTCDDRYKTYEAIKDAETRVASKILKKKFKYNESIDKKGESNARWHFGYSAQQIIEAFESEGLNPFDYAMIRKIPLISSHDMDDLGLTIDTLPDDKYKYEVILEQVNAFKIT